MMRRMSLIRVMLLMSPFHMHSGAVSLFQWAAFGDISHPPTSSVRIGEQATSSRAAVDPDVDLDEDEGSAYSAGSQDDEDSE